jgi:putative hemolysin
MELLIILGLVILNGIFSMSEMSLVASRKFKLESSGKRGHAGAKKALDLSENPTKFLSTVQIGITLIGILLGVYSGENLTNDLYEIIDNVAVLKPYAHEISTILIVVFITYLSIVLGELLPKRIGMTFPEPIIMVLAKPMWIISIITSPFVWLLTVSNNIILKILGIKSSDEGAVSEEEIRSLVKESAAVGQIQNIEHEIVERVFEMGDRKIHSLLTHRRKIVFLCIDDGWEQVTDKMKGGKYAAYPVSRTDKLDDLMGIVLLKDLFGQKLEKKLNLKKHLIEPIYVYEHTYAFEVLKMFKERKLDYAIVLDEYGHINGIVTLNDVLDALIGDAEEFRSRELKIVQRDADSWLVDGQLKLVDFIKYFDIIDDTLELSNATTVAGVFIELTGRIPSVGDTQIVESLKLEIVDMDGNRVDKILVSRMRD